MMKERLAPGPQSTAAPAGVSIEHKSSSKTGFYAGLRNRLRSSVARRMYWAVAKRDSLLAYRKEEGFYRSLLDGLGCDDVIFDVGANVGAKTEVFLSLGARVVAVEPDEAAQATLRDRFLRYRIRSRPVTIVGKAVSDRIGTEKMWIDGPGSAVNTLSKKWANYLHENKTKFQYQHCGLDFNSSTQVETTTIEELSNQYGAPFFVKLDVEGQELNALRGMLTPVPYLSFEINLRMFRREGEECIQTLSRLASGGQFNYASDCGTGLALKAWSGASDFYRELDRCSDDCIEVFWRSNARDGGQVH